MKKNNYNQYILSGAVVLGACIAPSTAFAAGFAFTTQSATSTGLGGVGVANSDEPNSSFYNPAAMTTRESFNIYVGATPVVPKVTWEGNNGEKNETVDALLPPPNFHLAIPFADDFAAGIGVTLPYGLTIEYPDDWEGRETIRRQSLQNININPNFAYEIPSTGLSLAIGGQFILTSVELENTTILRDDTEVETHVGGTGFGIGFTAAALYRPSENFEFGLNFRSGGDIDIDGKVHFEGEEGTPFENTFVDQGGTTVISLPSALTAGAGYRSDKVYLGLDVGFTTWSDYEKIELQFEIPCEEGDSGCVPGEDTNPPTNTINAQWFDSPTFRIGGEYKITENWPVRVGAAYDLSPIPDETVAPSLPGNDRGVLTAGTGYTWNGVRADIAYMAVITQREITNGSLDGTYNTFAQLLGVNLGYGF